MLGSGFKIIVKFNTELSHGHVEALSMTIHRKLETSPSSEEIWKRHTSEQLAKYLGKERKGAEVENLIAVIVNKLKNLELLMIISSVGAPVVIIVSGVWKGRVGYGRT